MHDKLEKMAAALLVVAVTTACGCYGWRREVQPLKYPLPACQPDVVPPQNAYGYLQQGPVFQGSHPGLPPMPTATEEAVRLRAEVEQLEGTKVELQQRANRLSGDVARKQAELQRAQEELRLAQQQVVSTTARVASWREDVQTMRQQLKNHEQQQSAALDGVVTLLNDVIADYESTSPATGKQGSEP